MPIGPLGMLVASTAAGVGANALNNSISMGQANKWNAKNFGQHKKVTEWNNEQAFKMWQRTGPVGMMAELKQAGLNPGMMYGMSGAGGGTAASDSSGPQGIKPDVNILAEAGNILGLEMQKAQIENIKADTENKKEDTTNKAGGERKKLEQETINLVQDVKNKQAVEKLTEAQTLMQNLQNEVANDTLEDAISRIRADANTAFQLQLQAQNETFIKNETQEDQIKIIKQTAIQAWLNTVLTRAQTENVRQDTAESKTRQAINEHTLGKIAAEIAQGWSSDMNEKEKNRIHEKLVDLIGEQIQWDQTMWGIDRILQLVPWMGKDGHTPVKGFNPKRY